MNYYNDLVFYLLKLSLNKKLGFFLLIKYLKELSVLGLGFYLQTGQTYAKK